VRSLSRRSPAPLRETPPVPESAGTRRDRGPTYRIEPKNKFLAAMCSINDFELRPANTVTFLSEVDLTGIEQIRAGAGEGGGIKPSYTAFVVKAVALSLSEFPYANRRVSRSLLRRPRVQKFHRIDAAVVAERSVPGAPMVAFVDMLRDADRLSLEEITDQLHAIGTADVATNKQLREFTNVITRLPIRLAALVLRMPALFPRLWINYRGGSFVITSPAKYGVDIVATTWPWSLGISFGIVKPRPLVRDGRVVACPTFTLSLNFDHRLMTGAPAAQFFTRIVDLLEHPGQMRGSQA
jgi:pyruvate/2-oxoglutarate dehydrogenase complex dihydrolipoamide acyltransferase (E2) component